MSDFDTLMDRAKRAIQQESLPRAQELLEEAALMAPGSRDVHSMLGVVYAKLGEPDLSIAEFRRVLKSDPDHLTTLRNLARVLEQQQRIDEAVGLIEHALVLDPEDAATNRVHKRLRGKIEGTDIPVFGEHADGLLGLCPVCENPIPLDTDRRTCDLCGVSWVPLISGRVRIEETLRVNEDQLVCAHCGSVIENYKAMHCVRCGQDFLTGGLPQAPSVDAAASPGRGSNSEQSGGTLRQPIPIWGVIAGAVFVVAMLLGRYHVVQGAGLIGVTLVPKVHFTWSETFVSVDAITGMPYIMAKSKYPLAVQALQRDGIIETEEEFEERNRREFEEEMQRWTTPTF